MHMYVCMYIYIYIYTYMLVHIYISDMCGQSSPNHRKKKTQTSNQILPAEGAGGIELIMIPLLARLVQAQFEATHTLW